MTTTTSADEGRVATEVAPTPAQPLWLRPTARPTGTDGPATRDDRDVVAARLTRPPFALRRGGRHSNAFDVGVELVLDWLAEQPGQNWQERWHASRIENEGRSCAFRQVIWPH